MAGKVGNDVGLQELQAIMSVTGLQDASYVAEQPSGKSCLLALRPIDVQNVEEAVLRHPLYPKLTDRPKTVLSNHVSRAGGRLRNWTPGRDGQDLTLTIGNRYLTSSRDVGGDVSINMSPIVDPLNVLRPLIKTERGVYGDQAWSLRINQPGGGSSQEYAFIPKLQAICLLDHIVEMDYNLSVIHVLASGQLSPLKKIKHKVGYRMSSLDESAPNKHLRCLTLSEAKGEVERTDVSIKEVA
ncbi:hypothetical protein V8D89_002303 [Ganoderma adspersum]